MLSTTKNFFEAWSLYLNTVSKSSPKISKQKKKNYSSWCYELKKVFAVLQDLIVKFYISLLQRCYCQIRITAHNISKIIPFIMYLQSKMMIIE